MSVVRVFRYGLTRGMLSDERVLALIFMIMTGGLPKMMSNWAVLTVSANILDQQLLYNSSMTQG